MDWEKDRKVLDDIHDTVVSMMKISTLQHKREEEVLFLEFSKIGLAGLHEDNIKQHKELKTIFLDILKETEKEKHIY